MAIHPPGLAVEKLREFLFDEHVDLMRRRDELLAAATRLPEAIVDEETAGKLADFIKALSAVAKTADEKRQWCKGPYWDVGKMIDGFFATITDPITAAQDAAELKLTEYQVARNIDGPVRGEYGSVATLRQGWTFADLDRTKIDLEILRPHLQPEAIERALRSFIRSGGREITGATIYRQVSTVVR